MKCMLSQSKSRERRLRADNGVEGSCRAVQPMTRRPVYTVGTHVGKLALSSCTEERPVPITRLFPVHQERHQLLRTEQLMTVMGFLCRCCTSLAIRNDVRYRAPSSSASASPQTGPWEQEWHRSFILQGMPPSRYCAVQPSPKLPRSASQLEASSVLASSSPHSTMHQHPQPPRQHIAFVMLSFP
ncbi:hypothetical protein BDW02DRAFT_225594 [Decorospora gaudefroyi]|uniref:Uncharacterized protein n=1 Tax=Decorospora gaudefroyi TaxID=184978 RepID=A0A6A5KSC6_9PLEO|nr:hypothetical protein BDW02DRAFT_225594 [Decorospora gaudefroyi]